ncbi:MAG: sensor histidine kinase KdpD [Erysipelotrichaceae bacterium]|nr:sensor histidine kinase KdpD [Erysipelotrichaceae bacterium]
MNFVDKGKLKIFFGYTENIGKTQAMLKAAWIAKERGVDVVVGYIAANVSEQMIEQLSQFEMLDLGKGRIFDIDRALERKPELILIDELAHTNNFNSRHKNRYQEVEELLNNGIDVYTTINVGNIESLRDLVASITGISAWESIPDFVFDNANQVELIDAEPQEIIEHLKEKNTAESRLSFEQLSALREIALRRCADRVKHVFERTQDKKAFHTDEHILACLSSAPSNAKIIRTAARMAKAFNSQFTALFVETSDFVTETKENKQRLRENQRLAQQLDANIETVYGDDVPYQIAEFARLSGITKIVLGRSAVTRKNFLGKQTLTEQLLAYAPEIDIHIIPDRSTDITYKHKKTKSLRKNEILKNGIISVAIFAGTTLLSILFEHLGFTDSNIIMVYILGVLLTSIVTSHQIYSLVSSVASVVIFNFLFTAPRFSLEAYGTGYPVTFVIMFLTAYITGTFAIRYKAQAGQSAKIAHRTKILFDTNQMLSKLNGKDEIFQATAKQIQKLLNRNIVIYENENGYLKNPYFSLVNENENNLYDFESEGITAKWVMTNNQSAGATTDTHAHVQYLYLAVRINDHVYGVLGIDAKESPLDASEHSIVISILGEAALALENEKNAREKEEAAVLVESEQLRANLLRAISHDLRTPLTSISGNANNLMANGKSFDEKTKQQMYADIYNDSMWLIDLVENLLYATRIEDGRMKLQTSAELLSEIVEESIQRIRPKANNHLLNVSHMDDLLLVKADAKLVVQVVTNIIDNALKYTPSGTSISIITKRVNDMAEIQIADTGNGISDKDKQHIFDKFYCGDNKVADNRRSLGLGLFLCKAIIHAHGGTISVSDNLPHGTIFTFTLPLEEASYYE